MNRFELCVKQMHTSDNGTEFEAWSYTGTTDPVKAVQIANKSLYRGRPLGKVSEIRLIDNWS